MGQRTGYTYAAAADDSTETYDATGRLQKTVARNGWTTTLTYSDATTPTLIAPRPGLLISVKNHFGRELKFTYDAAGQIVELLPPGALSGQPAGSAVSPIRYVYNEGTSFGAGVIALGQLTSIVWQDGATRRYTYEDARWRKIITGLIDEAGVRDLTRVTDVTACAHRRRSASGKSICPIAITTTGLINPQPGNSGNTCTTTALASYRSSLSGRKTRVAA